MAQLQKYFIEIVPEKSPTKPDTTRQEEGQMSIDRLSFILGKVSDEEYAKMYENSSEIFRGNLPGLWYGGNRTSNEIQNYSLEITKTCDRFLLLSKREDELIFVEETITCELKASFRTPHPEVPKPVVKDGRNIYQITDRNGKTTEFNSPKELRRFFQTKCLIAIVGLLNTRGGTLVIGVLEKDPFNEIVGIEWEAGFQNIDRYVRSIIQQINNRIGERFSSEFIDLRVETRDGKKVVFVECKPFVPGQTETPAFLDNEITYRRTGPRSDPVRGARSIAEFTIERQNAKLD